ncbi:MAG: hypothetical protein EZS28_050506, partial [Streblomastix strix]
MPTSPTNGRKGEKKPLEGG